MDRETFIIAVYCVVEHYHLPSDKDMGQDFRTHYPHFFPALGDRTLCVRQAAHLWQRLTHVRGQATAPIPPLDTLPLPVCVYTQIGRDRCVKPCAAYGYGAAKSLA